MRSRLGVALCLCLCAPWLAGCRGSSGRQALAELIPADALVVLTVNWQTVRDDRDLLALIKGAEFKKVFAEVNVNEETVDDLAVFGDGAEGKGGSAGMILNGSFDAGESADFIKGRGWREESYNGHEVYLSPADGTRCAALDSGALVCGTKKAVEGVIRAASDTDAAFVSTDAYERLSKLFDTAESPVSMMIAFPQHYQDAADAALQVSSAMLDFAGVGPLGQLMSKIGFSRAVGCTIGRDGDSFPVELVAVMKDEEAAALVSGGFTLLKGIGEWAGQQRPARSAAEAEALRNFHNMSIDRDGDVLSIGLVMSRRDLFPN